MRSAMNSGSRPRSSQVRAWSMSPSSMRAPNDTGSGSRDMFHGCARVGAANARSVKRNIVARMFARIALQL